MSPASGVVDAFKNLIRHGKNHRHARQENKQDDEEQHVTDHQVPRDVAEIIVNEEREAKLKAPSYLGLEKYSMCEKMGDGAFSDVYKALDTTTGRKCAIKVVRKHELNQSQANDKHHLNPKFNKKPRAAERTNILKEVQIMRSTNHSSIVKLYSFSESPEHYFLVLELMDGGELFHQIVKLTYFSENLSRHVILQVAQGIRYLHEERGIVHRDIKPENLLFERIQIIPSRVPLVRKYDENKEDEGEFIPGLGGGGIGAVKIADFGLSKVIWNEETMTPCGTVGYTAPEIVKDERYSKSVDMWALGCVLYTLLCGFPPFYDESINALTEKVAHGTYTFLKPWWDEISDSSKDLIQNLLCVDPALRFTIDEFLAHPWCTALHGPPPPPSPFSIVPMDSPLLVAARGGHYEGRSPGIATLKDAFDIAYAVHRAEEENARRRRYHGRGGVGVKGFLSGLNEDEEDEDEDEREIRAQLAQNHPRGRVKSPTHGSGGTGKSGVPMTPAQARKPRDTDARQKHNPKDFELDLHRATLLGRRHQQKVGSSLTSRTQLTNAIEGMRVRDL